MTITQIAGLSAPPISKPFGSLLDTASVTEGLEWLEPTGLFESYNCIKTDAVAQWPCPSTVMAAPTHTATTIFTTGGTMAQGTYRSVITAYNARGETVASNEITTVLANATSRISLNWNTVAGATGYNIYLTAVNGAAGSEKLIQGGLLAPANNWNVNDPPTYGSKVPPTVNGAVNTPDKTFFPAVWNDGIRFAAYAGAVCKGPGVWGDELDSLKAAFLASESRAVERALLTQRMTNSTTPTRDITPAGGAVDPAVGLALLEGDASCNYAGVPTIHAPVNIASLLARYGVAERNGDRLVSAMYGSKIVAGRGYGCPNYTPAGVAVPTSDPARFLYATGEVMVIRGDLVANQQIDKVTNNILSLVERPYVAAIDCYLVAVQVKVA